MVDLVCWYLFISLVGLVSLPATLWIFRGLVGSASALARPLGLLLWAYLFWLLASLGILSNDAGGAILAMALLVAINGYFVRRMGWSTIIGHLKSSRKQIVTGEILFVALFAAWALSRAMNPDITGTEKPMELAFINAILHSPSFPPNDPWLSGYAISYYYFGYVMIALLSRLAGTASGVAFNLASALWFAMTGVGAYGLITALLGSKDRKICRSYSSLWGLLGPFFLLIVSNVEGFLEVLHARGVFWQRQADGSLASLVWKWIDLQELVKPPVEPFGWLPERIGGIWWWRASRVLQDYDLSQHSREIIDEFPFFSYYLADLHPHVLAMPFVLLAIGLALNLFLYRCGGQVPSVGFSHLRRWFSPATGIITGHDGSSWVTRLDFWSTAFVFGGLAFLNTWDFPIYVAAFGATWVLLRYLQNGWGIKRIFEFVEISLLLGVAGVLFYMPFYFGFASQAGGFIPSISFFTRGIHFWIMFAPLLTPIFVWLIYSLIGVRTRAGVAAGLRFAIVCVFGLWFVSFLMGWIGSNLSFWGNLLAIGPNSFLNLKKFANGLITVGEAFLGMQGAVSSQSLLFVSLLLRITNPGTWLTLTFLLVLCWTCLHTFGRKNNSETTDIENSNTPFVVILVLVGAGLTLVPEFIYLRDQFGWRMNTIFKFYYQTWILWGLAAAYSSAVLWTRLVKLGRWFFGFVWVLLILMALAYPVFALMMRAENIRVENLTLDGTRYLKTQQPDEHAAMEWLAKEPPGVLAEAVGGSYSGFARMSAHSGQSTVLGWPGHESQWRGGVEEIGPREIDIQTLYRTSSWQEAQAIIDRYQIRYIVTGGLEKGAYRVNERKFQANLKTAFQEGNVTIYEVPREQVEIESVNNS